MLTPLNAAVVGLSLLVALAPLAGAQVSSSSEDAPKNFTSPAQVALGEYLFSLKELSQGNSTSCATCHDPLNSFIDGKADATGRLMVPTGRNSPTLFGIGKLKHFRDPGQSERARPGRKPRTLTLEERCLAPLANGLEMGDDPQYAVNVLREVNGMSARFDDAFGRSGEGVTLDRLGKVLASYVKSLPVPRSPYWRWLEGDQAALTQTERRGLDVFAGKGNCSACHAGDMLTDGLMHMVDPFDGQRIKDRERAAAERRILLLQQKYAASDPARFTKMTPAQIAAEAVKMAPHLPGGGGYDPSFVEVQTTTLWDVARTAPYFRDGSVTSLDRAVSIHVQELRQVAGRPKEGTKALAKAKVAGMNAPEKLRSSWKSLKQQPTPAELSPQELADLLAFLRTLSPIPNR